MCNFSVASSRVLRCVYLNGGSLHFRLGQDTRSSPEVVGSSPELGRSSPEVGRSSPEVARSSPEVGRSSLEFARSSPALAGNTAGSAIKAADYTDFTDVGGFN